MSPAEKRHTTMLEKLGSEAAIKQYYQDIQKKSRVTYVENGSKGGFRGIDPEKLKEISRLGGKKSRKGEKTN